MESLSLESLKISSAKPPLSDEEIQMNPIARLQELAQKRQWDSDILDMLSMEKPNQNYEDDMEHEIEDNGDKRERKPRSRKRVSKAMQLEREGDFCRRTGRYIKRSECSGERQLRTESPCIGNRRSRGNKISCPCSLFSLSRLEDERCQAEVRKYLERYRPRRHQNRLKPVDPNFLDAFKIVQKPKPQIQSESVENKRGRPLFPPESSVEDEYYENSDGLWIKRDVIRTADDLFPIIHKTIYPLPYPESEYATTECEDKDDQEVSRPLDYD